MTDTDLFARSRLSIFLGSTILESSCLKPWQIDTARAASAAEGAIAVEVQILTTTIGVDLRALQSLVLFIIFIRLRV